MAPIDHTMQSLLGVLSDKDYIYPLAACIVFQPLFYYGIIAAFPSTFNTVKQRAWILTTLNSVVMTFAAVPYLLAVLRNLPNNMDTASMMDWMVASKAVCGFFVSYLIGDLVLGTLLYPSQMNFGSGYFHHTIYIVMVTVIIQFNLQSLFVMMGCLELPTLLMSVAQINKKYRNDMLFGGTYFITRIVLHVYLIYHLYAHAYSHNYFFLFPLSTFPLHIMWFNAWIKQQKRIHAAKQLHKEAQQVAFAQQKPRVKSTSSMEDIKEKMKTAAAAVSMSMGISISRKPTQQRPERRAGARRMAVKAAEVANKAPQQPIANY